MYLFPLPLKLTVVILPIQCVESDVKPKQYTQFKLFTLNNTLIKRSSKRSICYILVYLTYTYIQMPFNRTLVSRITLLQEVNSMSFKS